MRRFFSILGMIICAGVFIVGLLMLTNVLPDDYIREDDGTYPPYTVNGYETDYGYAMFGSDYNSFSNNNMAMAAYNAERTATNTYIIVKALEILLVAAGAIGFCGFGIACSRKNVPQAGNVQSVSITTPDYKSSGVNNTSLAGNNIPASGKFVQQGAANKVNSTPTVGTSIHNAVPTGEYIAWKRVQMEQESKKQEE